MVKQRQPMLTVYDDYTCEVTGYGPRVQEFDLITPIDMNLHLVPLPAKSPFQEMTSPFESIRLDYRHEGEVRFSVRERPKPPKGPPYNTVDLADLAVTRRVIKEQERLKGVPW